MCLGALRQEGRGGFVLPQDVEGCAPSRLFRSTSMDLSPTLGVRRRRG